MEILGANRHNEDHHKCFFLFLFFVSSLISEENGKGNQRKLYRKDDMFAMKTTQARKFLFSA